MGKRGFVPEWGRGGVVFQDSVESEMVGFDCNGMALWV